MQFALRSTLTFIIILIRMMMVMVARSSAKAGMLAFVHTFTIGAVNFSAVGFSDIFVTLSCNRILIAVSGIRVHNQLGTHQKGRQQKPERWCC